MDKRLSSTQCMSAAHVHAMHATVPFVKGFRFAQDMKKMHECRYLFSEVTQLDDTQKTVRTRESERETYVLGVVTSIGLSWNLLLETHTMSFKELFDPSLGLPPLVGYHLFKQ